MAAKSKQRTAQETSNKRIEELAVRLAQAEAERDAARQDASNAREESAKHVGGKLESLETQYTALLAALSDRDRDERP